MTKNTRQTSEFSVNTTIGCPGSSFGRPLRFPLLHLWFDHRCGHVRWLWQDVYTVYGSLYPYNVYARILEYMEESIYGKEEEKRKRRKWMKEKKMCRCPLSLVLAMWLKFSCYKQDRGSICHTRVHFWDSAVLSNVDSVLSKKTTDLPYRLRTHTRSTICRYQIKYPYHQSTLFHCAFFILCVFCLFVFVGVLFVCFFLNHLTLIW